MRVSIVVPSFNHERFIETTLRSLISQREDGVDLEILVMDGGSKDGTQKILEQLDAEIDGWVSEPDEGQAHALAKGFARCTGDVMGWLNSDDVLLPGALASITAYLERKSTIDLVYGDAVWMDVDGRAIKTQHEVSFDLPMLLWGYNYIPQPSTFWRRSIWEQSGGIDQSYDCAFDYALWLSMIKQGAVVAHLPRLLSGFRFYAEQKNQRLRAMSDAEDRRLVSAFIDREITAVERLTRRAYHRGRRAMIRAALGSLTKRGEHRGMPVEKITASLNSSVNPSSQELAQAA